MQAPTQGPRLEVARVKRGCVRPSALGVWQWRMPVGKSAVGQSSWGRAISSLRLGFAWLNRCQDRDLAIRPELAHAGRPALVGLVVVGILQHEDVFAADSDSGGRPRF